jgi:chemotaxis protein MotB
VPLEDYMDERPPVEERAPGWIVTFADLMALLMCFFVLLLSFSSMDVENYKRIAETMRSAFGVQTQMHFDGSTANGFVQAHAPVEPVVSPPSPSAACVTQDPVEAQELGADREAEQHIVDSVATLVGETEHDAVMMATALSKEIAAGVLEVETNGRRIVLRVKEHGTFASGSASLTKDFKPVLKIVRGVLKDTKGQIAVEGHTDDVPITTAEFHSNLELSTSRAISVAHGLFEDGSLDQRRFTVAGYADSRPLVTNSTPEGRVKNRRVEVVVDQGLGDVKRDLDTLRGNDAEAFGRVRTELMRRFNLKPDEIY